MGRTLRILLPCALGLVAAFLASCGDTSKLIPGDDAAAINSNIDAASNASSSGRCSRAAAAVDRAEAHVQQLPSSVDAKLKADLEQGLQRLRAAAATECSQNKTDTTTTESTEATTTEATTTEATTTENTQTQPTETQPTETQNTETLNTDTTGGNGGETGGGTGGGNGQGGGNGGGNGQGGGTQAP
jgi:membrane protein involved in colicin uptake